MDRFYRFVGRYWIDTLALALSVVVLGAGIYLAWFISPVWLNRAGSIIIIIGVSVAASRFHEWLQKKADEFIEANYKAVFNDVVESIEKEKSIKLSEQERDRLNSELKSHVHKGLASVIEDDKRRVKLYEIYLVIGGTFLNGFGDYFVCMLRTCQP